MGKGYKYRMSEPQPPSPAPNPSRFRYRPTFLSITAVVFLLINIFICLFICKINGTCTNTPPTISMTGAHYPGLSLFSCSFTCTAWFAMLICVCRHQYVKMYCAKMNVNIEKLNNYSAYSKCLMLVGMLLIGNVQCASPLYSLHYLGALLGFGGGIAYMTLDFTISCMVYPSGGSTGHELVIRGFCTIWLYGSVLLMMQELYYYPTTKDWSHAEWLMLLGLCASWMTYIIDFRKMYVTVVFEIKQDDEAAAVQDDPMKKEN